MKIIIVIIQWCVGVFLSLGGLGGLLSGDFLMAIPCFGIGLALLPPVQERFMKKKKHCTS